MKKSYFAIFVLVILALFCFAGCANTEKPGPEGPGTDIPSPDNPDDPVTPSKNYYTVTWDVGGKRDYETYEEGSTPVYSGSTAKAADAQYTYTFSGWSPAISEVTGNATYTAQYTQTVKTYTVTWVVDGKKTEQTYKYGDTPSYSGSLSKADDANYSYTFSNWDKNIVKVTGNATYTAVFSKTALVKYKITWVVDGAKRYTEVSRGEVPSYSKVFGGNPTKDTPQYTYTFKGWTTIDSPSAAVVTLTPAMSDMTYYAKFEQSVKEYTVTWRIPSSATATSNNKSVTSKEQFGATPVYPNAALPTRNGYVLTGWKSSNGTTYSLTETLPAVMSDVTYEAVWATTSKLTVTFNIAGQVVYSNSNVAGTVGQITLSYPNLKLMRTLNSSGNYVYTYLDTASRRVYTVTGFKSSLTGATVSLSSAVNQTFPVTSNVVYTAVATSTTYTSGTYGVKWMLNNDSLIAFNYGITSGSAATPPAHNSSLFPETVGNLKFAGWALSPTATTPITTLPPVTANMTYYAIYKPNTTSYEISWNIDGAVTKTNCGAGSVPAYPGAPTKQGYTFKGWAATQGGTVLSTLPAASANVTYYAVFEANTVTYTVSWYNKDGVLIDTTSVLTGNVPTHADPVLDGYIFRGWAATQGGAVISPLPAVTANTSYYAVFTDNRFVTYTFMGKSSTGEDRVLSTVSSEKVAGYAPIVNVPSVSNYTIGNVTYKFQGWRIGADATVYTGEQLTSKSYSQDVTITAVYSSVNSYSVSFVANGRTVKSLPAVEEGTAILPLAPADPKRAADADFYYEFKGWKVQGTDDIVADFGTVSANVVYEAVFEAKGGSVTIRWYVDGSISKNYYAPGESVTVPANPVKDGYNFVGWADSSTSDVPVSPAATATANADYYAIFTEITE